MFQFLQEIEAVESFRKRNADKKTIQRANERLEELRVPLLAYEHISNLTKAGKQQEAIKLLMDLQTFEQNFLSIIVSRPNFDLERVEEKAVVSMTSLFSQIGGLLSIWIGLTFVCIVEIVELVLNIADAIIRYKHRRTQNQ